MFQIGKQKNEMANQMGRNYPIETVSAAAIGENISGVTLLVVDTHRRNGVLDALYGLYAGTPVKVLYTKVGADRIDVTIAKAEKGGMKSIVLCGEELIKPQSILPQNRHYSAALVSAGSYRKENNILQYILNDKSVTEFAHIGYQIYRYEPSIMQKFRARNFEELRLGSLRSEIILAEPLIRAKENIFMDLQSVRFGDLPDNTSLSPNGLYAEELCHIARYVGMAQKLKSVFIYGYLSKSKSITPSYNLVAEIIWHIAEALSSNIFEDPANTGREDSFLRKIVSMGDEGQDIVFITSPVTGRWWMEIPEIEAGGYRYIACSNSDYLTACSGEIPVRWLYFLQRINS